VPGELVDIGRRPKLVASFAGRGATARFDAWREQNAELLARVPPTALRVEYAAAADGRTIRVRIDESELPAGLSGPDEAGAADGLPPGPAAA
jgi:hypothetical protein